MCGFDTGCPGFLAKPGRRSCIAGSAATTLLLGGVLVLVLSGAAYLYHRSGKMHTMRANRLQSMLTQLDAILEGEGEDALPQDAAAAAAFRASSR